MKEIITTGFKFKFNDQEVTVSSDRGDTIILTRDEDYILEGPVSKDFVLNYLKETGQINLINYQDIVIGEKVAEFLCLNKERKGANKGLYKTKYSHKNIRELGAAVQDIIKHYT